MELQSQQQGNMGGTMSLGANLSWGRHSQPEGPLSKCCLQLPLPHPLFLPVLQGSASQSH